jgi:hypothetical protein
VFCATSNRTAQNSVHTHNTDDLLWRNTTITGIQSRILSNWKSFINFNKSVWTILSTSVTHTRQHACNKYEAFPLKCWSPSDDGHHWPKHVKFNFITKNIVALDGIQSWFYLYRIIQFNSYWNSALFVKKKKTVYELDLPHPKLSRLKKEGAQESEFSS